MATRGLVRRARERWRNRRAGTSGPQPHPGPLAPHGIQRARSAYRGDFEGRATIEYAPSADGDADPGEVVWAWVPYEDDPSQGKDRPVLVLARAGDDLLGLMLTSKDHVGGTRPGDDRPGAPVWLDLGSGAWDRQGRPSEVRLDRVLRLAPADVRREGAALDRVRFDKVAAAVRQANGW